METEAEVAASPRVHLELTNEEALAIIKRMVKLSNLFLNGEKSKEHEWFEELCEALKKSYTTPANLTFAYKDGFRGGHSAVVNSLHQILTLLRDSLLHMRYAESAHILKAIIEGCMVNMPLALEIAVRRAGLEIMYNSSDVYTPPLNSFFDQLRSINTTINPQQVVLDQFIHHLTSDKFEEAIDVISNLPKVNKHMASTDHAKHVAQLYTAYKGLAYYMQWQRMERDKSESQQIFTQNQEQLAKSALQQFQSLLTEPTGVWDLFIPNQVHLLISLGRHNEVEKLLLSYKKKNDENPFAWKHLLQYYEYSGADQEYLRTLQAYCKKWPMDKTMCLKLISHMSLSQHAALVANTYFRLLDYSCHKDDVELWEKFHEFLAGIRYEEDSKVWEEVSNQWKWRESWWVSYHFTDRTGEEQPSELFVTKTDIHSILKDM